MPLDDLEDTQGFWLFLATMAFIGFCILMAQRDIVLGILAATIVVACIRGWATVRDDDDWGL